MEKRIVTIDTLEEVATLVQAEMGEHPSPEEVHAFLVTKGFSAGMSMNWVTKIKAEINRLRKEQQDKLFSILVTKLPINPSQSTIQKKALEYGVVLSEFASRKLTKRLRQVPSLWSSEGSLKKQITLASPVDAEILRQLEKATGLPTSDCVALALRAFVVSYSQSNLGVDTLVRTSRGTSDSELAPYVQMLRTLDLRRLCK